MNDTRPEYPTLPTGSYLPYLPNPHFVGREAELEKLAELATVGGVAAVHAQAGLTGLGGVGKTQLAIEFAHRHGRLFPGGVFWIPCINPDLLPTMIAHCAGPEGLNWPHLEHLKQAEVVGRVQAYWRSGQPCLLIFDNCEDPQVLERYAPTTGRVLLLLTSRKDNWRWSHPAVQAISLDVLSPAESQQLLQTLAHHLTPAEADQVAEQLGHFPLALELAGKYLAYLHGAGSPVAVPVYVEQLQQKLLEHDSLKGWIGMKSPTKHELHVEATFLLSYEPLRKPDKVSLLAQKMLTGLACLAPNTPIELAWLKPLWAEETEMMVAVAFNHLLSLGLVSQPTAGQTKLHRLITQFVQGEAPPPAGLLAQVGELLRGKANKINEQGLPKLFELLLPHVVWLAEKLEKGEELETAAGLWNGLGNYYYINGEYPLAQSALEQALYLAQQCLEANHPTIATSLNNLGLLLMDMGDLVGAKRHAEQALAIQEQVLGKNHPHVAISLNNLGLILQELGDYAGAKSYAEQALAIDAQVLGAQEVAADLNNLGQILLAMGDYAGAKRHVEQALTILEQVFGKNHPKVALSLSNLGQILKYMGDLAGAKRHAEQALTISEQVFGKNHPQVATSLNNLGQILKYMGDLEGAKTQAEQALAILEPVLGRNHPKVALALNNLGQILKDLGDLAEAKQYAEKALAIVEQVLGRNHPNVAILLNNLGGILMDMGDLAGAKLYAEQALAILKKTLGENHPHTQIARHNLEGIVRKLKG